MLYLPGCEKIKYVHYWTDSPTSQYRNRFIFDAIVNHESVFGCHATWNYYESGHGKSVCDGLGGTVKRLADESVRSGKCTIQDAEEFKTWAENSSLKAVTFFFVTQEECDIASKKNCNKSQHLQSMVHSSCTLSGSMVQVSCAHVPCRAIAKPASPETFATPGLLLTTEHPQERELTLKQVRQKLTSLVTTQETSLQLSMKANGVLGK